MLRLLNRRRARADTTAQHTKEDLFDTLIRGNYSSHDDLLEVIRAYPEEVISSFQDAMGNSILHIILCGNFTTVDTSDNLDNNNGISSTILVRRNFLVEADGDDYLEKRRKGNGKSCSLLPIMHFIVHCSNAVDKQNNHNEPDSSNSISATCSSIFWRRSAEGCLPLHIACRFCSFQELDVVQYLVQEYPYALQCTDVWGNLPLHEACGSSCIALEVVILLLQHYPKAASVPNDDGNIPLHLSVALKYTSNIPGKQCLAADEHQLAVVQCLLCYWSDAVHHTNLTGETALQMAKGCSNNVLVIEFLQSIAEPLVSPSLSQENKNRDVGYHGDYSSIKVPTNPFDDEYYGDQTKLFPDLIVYEPEGFNRKKSMEVNDTLRMDAALIHDEKGRNRRASDGIEPEDLSEHLCVELVEDFQIVSNKNWSEYNPFSQDEYKETEYL
jgi:hypothetical protein